jgi:hypothetical protein
MSHRVKFLHKQEKEAPHLDPALFPPKLDVVRIEVTGLDQDELLWYNWLDEADLKALEKGYFEKVYGRRTMLGVSYAQFVKTCAKVAVKLHLKMSQKEVRALAKLEEIGERGKL